MRAGPGLPHPRRDPASRGAALAWALVAVWAVLIWWLGSGGFDASTTSRWLAPLLEWLLPEATVQQRLEIAKVLRKLAHPIEYAVLAGLSLHAAASSGLARLLAAASALGLAIALAVLDELRQATLASRTGSLGDVALDVAGAACALAVLLWLFPARDARADPRHG